ncbi:MAG: PAS domain S-box protein [Desulfobacteraceae bacterium]|nr:MAG: PAS domain S-box protein [Desulfobacteraceae bacterium]
MDDMDQPKGAGFRKRLIVGVVVAALAILAAGTLLNVRFGRAALQVAKDQFNEEQLVVSRNVKYWVERQIVFLSQELLLAAKQIEGSAPQAEAVHTLLEPCFQRVMELGVAKIEITQAERGLAYVHYPNRPMVVDIAHAPGLLPAQASLPDGPAVVISDPTIDGSDMYLKLSAPLVHASLDSIAFHLNLSWFLGPFLKHIRSGKTGYAWIIDGQGRFLCHPHAAFIGKSAFEARQERDPGVSHVLINTIQRERMLKGREGTGSYEAAWHRGITGKIEKLIAYSPITVSTVPPQNWSVAVVAPVYEIEEAVRKIHRWRAMLQALVMLVVVAGGGALLFFEMRWSRLLEKTVQARTAALKRSEENYRSLVESAEDFIFTLDGQGNLLSVNSFTANFFGGRPEELTGRGVDLLFSKEVAARQVKIASRVFESGKSVRDEFELRMGTGEIWISANFMPLKSETGQMGAVLCIARDITENKKLERYLINTEKLASLGTLAAGVAHEINNPLGVILGFCDLLVRRKEPCSQEYEDLKIIERQGMHCKQIVENLLSFARVGRETTNETDLNACLQEIIKVVFHSLEMKGIELRTEFAESLPKVNGDDRQLQQVFLNLINNAAAAMPEGGVLCIRTGVAGGGKKVAVQVQDQGIGIEAEILDHIFEPFFTTKPEGEGTGLGLFVSYGIINKFGGSICCESQTQPTREKPKGTIFTVKLPVRTGEEKWRVES